MNEYIFDRYRRGVKMAEGIVVKAENLTDAREAAEKLNHTPQNWLDDSHRQDERLELREHRAN